MAEYIKAMQADKRESARYFKFSVDNKTEQQKALERILFERDIVPQFIADIACGGGGASAHLAKYYPQSQFTLVDANEDAITMARQATENFSATCVVGDICNLKLNSDSFDLVICWQTLSWLDNPGIALRELVRICKPGGMVLASSLFNLSHDVDVYSTVIDHTRPSAGYGMRYSYNTYSIRTVREWLSGLVTYLNIHEFSMPIDLSHDERGIGTYTVKLETGNRLQISAGMLLNWGILEVIK